VDRAGSIPAVSVSISEGWQTVRVVWASYTFDAIPLELAERAVICLLSGELDLQKSGRFAPRYVMTLDADGSKFSAYRSHGIEDVEAWELSLIRS
jgi:hypothetical protein